MTSGKSLALSSVKIIDKLMVAMAIGFLVEPLMPYSRDSGCRHQLRVSGWDTGCQISHMFCDVYNRLLKSFHTWGHAYTKNSSIDLKFKISLQQNTRPDNPLLTHWMESVLSHLQDCSDKDPLWLSVFGQLGDSKAILNWSLFNSLLGEMSWFWCFVSGTQSISVGKKLTANWMEDWSW